MAGASFFAFQPTHLAHAADQRDIGFSVQPVMPSGASDPTATWFAYKLNTNESRSLTVRVFNTSGQNIQVIGEPVVARTNEQGQIVYNDVTSKRDRSLRLDFTDLGPKQVSFQVPANHSVPVTFTVQVPKTQFSGIVLGSLLFYSPTINALHQKDPQTGRPLALQNQYQYAIPVLLNVNNGAGTLPQLQIDSVIPKTVNRAPYLEAQVHNSAAGLVSGSSMHINARVYYRGGSKVLYRKSQSQMNFAPNSVLPYQVPLKLPVTAGSYTMKMAVQVGQHTWHLTRNFTISAAQAARLNPKGVVKQNYFWLLLLGGLVIIILVLAIIAWFYRAGKKKALLNKTRE